MAPAEQDDSDDQDSGLDADQDESDSAGDDVDEGHIAWYADFDGDDFDSSSETGPWISRFHDREVFSAESAFTSENLRRSNPQDNGAGSVALASDNRNQQSLVLALRGDLVQSSEQQYVVSQDGLARSSEQQDVTSQDDLNQCSSAHDTTSDVGHDEAAPTTSNFL